MPKSTTTNRGKWNRRQLVAYYREWPAGSDHDSVATQKQIIATWAAENGYEIVEEATDRRPVPLPANCYFEVGGMIQQYVTKRGDRLYVRKMDAHVWRHWRRSDMALGSSKLSKNQGDRAVFVTTDWDTASYLTWLLLLATGDHCTRSERRARIAVARRRKRA